MTKKRISEEDDTGVAIVAYVYGIVGTLWCMVYLFSRADNAFELILAFIGSFLIGPFFPIFKLMEYLVSIKL